MIQKILSSILLSLVFTSPIYAQTQVTAAAGVTNTPAGQQVARVKQDILINLDELTSMEKGRVRILLA